MKDYKRLTKWSELGTLHIFDFNGKEISLYDVTSLDCDNLVGRLAELEDMIESGELISTKETGDTEIEFFVKHNQIVRKTVIKQFAKDLKEKEQSIKVGNEWVAIITDKDIDELLHKRYSIKLEEEAEE